MEDIGTYVSELMKVSAPLLASTALLVGDFVLKQAAPKFYENWAKGEVGRLALVILVSMGVFFAGYAAWHANFNELQTLRAAQAAPDRVASTPAPSRPVYPALQAEAASARSSDNEINSQIDRLLSQAEAIQGDANSFHGDFDQVASASEITGWQTSAALFLRDEIGPEAERDFRDVNPVPPDNRVGDRLNGPAAASVSVFTAQREVLRAYRR